MSDLSSMHNVLIFLFLVFLEGKCKDAKIVLAVSMGCKLCACSTKSVNLEMYSCIESSDCLNIVSLHLVIVEFPHSENRSYNRVFMTGQFLPAECSSLRLV